MAACALIVEFRLQPGRWPEFHAIMSGHAQTTRAEEPGCRQFDILHDDDDPDRVFLVEVYADHDAYEAHRNNPRMPGVNEKVAPLTLQRSRSICTVS